MKENAKRRAGTTRRKRVGPAANEYANRFMFFVNELITKGKIHSLNHLCETNDYHVHSAYAFVSGKQQRLTNDFLVALHKSYNLNLNWFFTGEGKMEIDNGN